jgi:RNA polymerase sigma-70 factor (ECF subfamily)
MRAPANAEHLGPAVHNNNALVDAYLVKRADLIRFFTLRLRSPAAGEDLVQEIYLKVAALEPGTRIDNPAAYLYRLGHNLMLDRLRSERRAAAREADYRQGHHAQIAGEDVADFAPADEAVASRLRLERLVAALQAVSPLTRQVFIRHKFDGCSQAEVAAQLGLSRSAVEKHVAAALKHLLRSLT